MSSKSDKETPTIAIKSNWLTVDKRKLRADVLTDEQSDKLPVSASELENILLLGRRTIVEGVETYYEQQVAKYPSATISKPSVWVAQLGSEAQTEGRDSQVFTESGYDNGGIIYSENEIKPQFHDHWSTVKEAGFIPEVRRTSGKLDGGSWLLLRKPSLDDVLQHWFGYREGFIDDVIERLKQEDPDARWRRLMSYHKVGERIAEQHPHNQSPRPQLALILSMAAVKLALENTRGFEEEIDDAFDYADYHPAGIDLSTVRAIQNSTFKLS